MLDFPETYTHAHTRTHSNRRSQKGEGGGVHGECQFGQPEHGDCAVFFFLVFFFSCSSTRAPVLCVCRQPSKSGMMEKPARQQAGTTTITTKYTFLPFFAEYGEQHTLSIVSFFEGRTQKRIHTQTHAGLKRVFSTPKFVFPPVPAHKLHTFAHTNTLHYCTP